MKVLSYGAGVNSTAILALHAQGKYRVDAAIFADTHGEYPGTYNYIKKVTKPQCEKLGINFHVISEGSVYDYYWNHTIIPFRRFRQCTDKFKIRPLKKFAKEKFGHEVTWIIGIDYGEQHRADRFIGQGMEFPLIEMEIDREGCKRLIEVVGWPIPDKSGCYFCPYQRKDEWVRLLKENRKLFLKAEAFEKNGRGYPEHHLTRQTLESLRKATENQKSLCEWVESDGDPCIFCHS